MPRDRHHDVAIQSLAIGGDGVGLIGEKPCYVSFSAPGDNLTIRIKKEKKRFVIADIVRINHPGNDRVTPACPLFGQCGGCAWQHLNPTAQLSAKQSILEKALGIAPVDMVASDTAYAYRHVARLHAAPSGGNRVLGFYHRDRRRLLPIDACPVLAPRLVHVLPAIQARLLAHLDGPCEVRIALGKGGPTAAVRASGTVTERFYEAARGLVPAPFQGILLDTEGIASIVAGSDSIQSTGVDKQPFETPVGSFGQANPFINRCIADTLRDWTRGKGFSTGLELFAGSGNLTVGYASAISRLTISELDRTACISAEQNLANRSLDHVRVVAGDALDVYRRHGKKADLVVLDPPRDGHATVVRDIASGPHRAVVYVSCNPISLSRDLATLKESGYNLTHARGFDMFPQTPHLEAAVMMER